MYYAFSIEYTVLYPHSFEVKYHRVTRGVVKADSEEAARELVFARFGNDYAHNLELIPIPPDEDIFVISESKF